MIRKTRLAASLCAIGALGLAACSSSSSPSSSNSPSTNPSTSTSASASTAPSSSSSSTLVMESSPSGPVSDSFNPFSSTAAGNILGSNQMVYEPLLQFNLLKPGAFYPWLATGYKWSAGGKTITFTLRSGVKFTNGEAWNASEAAWEFGLIKKNTAINGNGLPIASATAPNATTLVINFTAPQYTNLYNIANTAMIPENVWKSVGNPATYADATPIGTGPYTLKSFSPQAVFFQANPNYWQPGLPKVQSLEFPAYDSNTTANLALEQDQLDWGGNFVQNIKTAFVGKNPAHHHYWDTGLQTETLIPNLTKPPLNDLAVRQAISYGVNRQIISHVGEDDQQPPVQGPGSLTGITLPLDQKFVTPEVSQYTATTDTNKAESILKADGWAKDSKGFYAKNGQELAFSIEDPSAYTDFITDDQIMSQELKAIGMNVTVNGTSVQKWTTDLATGNFQAIAHWGNGGPTPYNMYDNWLDSTLTAPIGKTATGDYERFNDPAAMAALKDFAGTSDEAQQAKDVVALEKIVATQLPVIPLFYGVAWFEYNDTKFTGWPSPSNPYAPGEPAGPFDEITVLHLTPVAS